MGADGAYPVDGGEVRPGCRAWAEMVTRELKVIEKIMRVKKGDFADPKQV
jgi:hypothetical protein